MHHVEQHSVLRADTKPNASANAIADVAADTRADAVSDDASDTTAHADSDDSPDPDPCIADRGADGFADPESNADANLL